MTGQATPLLGDFFSPTRSLAQVTPSPFFLRVLAEEVTASQAGPDWLGKRGRRGGEEEVAGAGSRRQLMRGARAAVVYEPVTVSEPQRGQEGSGCQRGLAKQHSSSYVTSLLPAPGPAGCAGAAAAPPFPPGLFLIRG